MYAAALDLLELSQPDRWDIWELFVVLALRLLREGGRMAFVLPDSILYPEKEKTRRILLAQCDIEKVFNLGPGWFGPTVRMGTVVLQARRGKIQPQYCFSGLVLSGDLRKKAIRGEVPLTQIENRLGQDIEIARVQRNAALDFELFRGLQDDVLMERMLANSIKLSDICRRSRGEEINKAGEMWECPSCLRLTVPGEKAKGGGYRAKVCPDCNYLIPPTSRLVSIIEHARPASSAYASFVDGDDINHRYKHINPHKWIKLDVSGWSYKDPGAYRGPKILVRQAGVGLTATIDYTDSMCPQSVYLYRLTEEYAAIGLANEYVLAALTSRTMLYYVFKCFSEIDPDKAHAKLTHERLSELPIPRVNFSNEAHVQLHNSIVSSALEMLHGAEAGSTPDRTIEQSLRTLWGLTAEDGAYINAQFYGLPNSQPVKDLFPDGPPSR